MRKNEEYDVNRREYDEKVEEIRQKKRKLRDIQEPELVKKLKKDLKREQRSEKRSDYNNLEIYIKEEIADYEFKKNKENKK